MIATVAEWLREADALVLTAGAGMGVDSGLPDFRGNEGFWRAYPALAKAGIAFTSIASPRAFRAQPEVAWGFYGHRLNLYRATVPHEGFGILRRWASSKPKGARVFTSNVDGQFQRAGFEQVHECHGSIHHLQCSVPCTDEIWPAEGFVPEVDVAECRLTSPLPRCPRCGRLARPNILMFSDGEWLGSRSAGQGTELDRWLRDAHNPVVIELGAGTAVPSVRRFGEALKGRRLVRINPREPEGGDLSLAMGALEALRAIDAEIT